MTTFWDIYATAYDALPAALPSYARTVDLVCDRVRQLTDAGCRVLDAGCGTGNYSVALSRLGFDVTAVDSSRAMLRRAKGKAAADGLPVSLHQADMSQRLPSPDASFDAVVSVMVLYAMPDPQQFLAELRRVTRAAGVLVLVTTDDRSLVASGAREVVREFGMASAIPRLCALMGVGVLNAVIDARFGRRYTGFREQDLRGLLSESGWRVAESRSCYVDGAATMVVARPGVIERACGTANNEFEPSRFARGSTQPR